MRFEGEILIAQKSATCIPSILEVLSNTKNSTQPTHQQQPLNLNVNIHPSLPARAAMNGDVLTLAILYLFIYLFIIALQHDKDYKRIMTYRGC